MFRTPAQAWPRALRTGALALLVQPLALADARVKPARAILAAGATCRFEAFLDGPGPGPVLWRWTLVSGPGAIDAATGLYQAPESAGAAVAWVRAECLDPPGPEGRACVMVLPLPATVSGLVGATQGEAWAEPWEAALPFLDLETGRRPQPGIRVINEGTFVSTRSILAGCGLPFDLRLREEGPVDAVRVSYREGGQPIRRDLAGRAAQDIPLRFSGKVTSLWLEGLQRSGPGRWQSAICAYPVRVRGLLPLAGNAVAPGGHLDGPGQAARFREPFGLVRVEGPEGAPSILVVSDPGDHVLRTVTPEGAAATLCGHPGEPGHRDSPGWLSWLAAFGRSAPALFRSPTHLAVDWNPHCGLCDPNPREILVADSGNHVIRRVRMDGTACTVAGTPGLAGHRDAEDPAAAAFDNPQGLVAANEGRIYVADQGNRVIRVIEPNGRVRTLAGTPGAAGSTDGVGGSARFTRLKGLCLGPGGTALYVLDGHALRRVQLPGAEVTTLLGVVDQPGFQDILEESLERRQAAVRLPCLRDPTGVTWSQNALHIADHGNHAIRSFHPRRSVLRTLVGDPGEARLRWGLVRDALPGPLDERYGTLEAPCTLARLPPGAEQSALYVASGRCVAEIHHALDGREIVDLHGPEHPGEARMGEPCAVTFSVSRTGAGQLHTLGRLHYVLERLDPDGSVGAQARGETDGGAVSVVLGSYDEPGMVRVRARVVSEQGVSVWRDLEVQVR